MRGLLLAALAGGLSRPARAGAGRRPSRLSTCTCTPDRSASSVASRPTAASAAEGVEMHGVDPGKPFDFTAQATCKRMVKAPASDAALIAERCA